MCHAIFGVLYFMWQPYKSDFIQVLLLYRIHKKIIRTLLDALLTFGYNVPVATFPQTHSTKSQGLTRCDYTLINGQICLQNKLPSFLESHSAYQDIKGVEKSYRKNMHCTHTPFSKYASILRFQALQQNSLSMRVPSLCHMASFAESSGSVTGPGFTLADFIFPYGYKENRSLRPGP